MKKKWLREPFRGLGKTHHRKPGSFLTNANFKRTGLERRLCLPASWTQRAKPCKKLYGLLPVFCGSSAKFTLKCQPTFMVAVCSHHGRTQRSGTPPCLQGSGAYQKSVQAYHEDLSTYFDNKPFCRRLLRGHGPAHGESLQGPFG